MRASTRHLGASREQGRIARTISGLAHASVPVLLMLPFFIRFSADCGPALFSTPSDYELCADVSGYQALVGFTLPAAVPDPVALPGAPVVALPAVGPNGWVALLLVVALAGAVAGGLGGGRAALARIATAAIGIIVASAAATYPGTVASHGVTVYEGSDFGTLLIQAVLAMAILIDGLRAFRRPRS